MVETTKYFIDGQGNYLGAWDGYYKTVPILDGDGNETGETEQVFVPPEYPAGGIEMPGPPPSGDGRQKGDPATAQWLPFTPPPVVREVFVSDIWGALTDPEAEAFDTAMATASPLRLRKQFNSATSFMSDSELYTFVKGVMTGAIGAARAGEVM